MKTRLSFWWFCNRPVIMRNLHRLEIFTYGFNEGVKLQNRMLKTELAPIIHDLKKSKDNNKIIKELQRVIRTIQSENTKTFE